MTDLSRMRSWWWRRTCSGVCPTAGRPARECRSCRRGVCLRLALGGAWGGGVVSAASWPLPVTAAVALLGAVVLGSLQVVASHRWGHRWARPVVDGLRITPRRARLLAVLLADVPGLSGYRLCELARLGPGTVYPLLERLELRGWVTGEWEAPEPLPDRPRRRFYRLTLVGRVRALRALDAYAVPGRG